MPDRLRAAGFLTPLVHCDVLAGSSTRAELAEFDEIERELAIETVLSSDPSSILFGDCEDQAVQSPTLRARIRDRLERHGSASSLTCDPARQRFIQLSAIGQRLSRAFQHRFGEGAEIVAMIEGAERQARRMELLMFSKEIAALSGGFGFDDFGVRRMLHRALADLGWEARRGSHEPTMRFGNSTVVRIAALQDTFSELSAPGRLVLQLLATNVAIGKPIGNESLIFFPQALPGGFRCYSRFRSMQEAALSCLAWGFAINELAASLSEQAEDLTLFVPEARQHGKDGLAPGFVDLQT